MTRIAQKITRIGFVRNIKHFFKLEAEKSMFSYLKRSLNPPAGYGVPSE